MSSYKHIMAVLVTVLCALPSDACNLPVFRYALERWDAGPYYAVVFFKDSLTKSQMDAVSKLVIAPIGATPDSSVYYKPRPERVRIILVNAGKQPGNQRSPMIDSIIKDRPLPWLRMHYADMYHDHTTDMPCSPVVWQGPLSQMRAGQLHASPIRKEIFRRILGGESGVWVLMQSGNRQADMKAYALLKKTLERCSAELKLDNRIYGPLPPWFERRHSPMMKVSFSVLTFSPEDPNESYLTKMLNNHHPGGLPNVNGPVAFEVFGQGRALPGLHGATLTDSAITAQCDYLLKYCSCEVKNQNPGFDLLFNTDWHDRPLMETVCIPDMPASAASAVSESMSLTGMTAMPMPDSAGVARDTGAAVKDTGRGKVGAGKPGKR